MRSYFLPFIIVYIIKTTHEYFKNNNNPLPYATLLKQLTIVFFFIYSAYFTYSTEKAYSQTVSQFYDRSTLFDLIHEDKTTIKQRQLKKAEIYWKEDFFKDTDNIIKNNND